MSEQWLEDLKKKLAKHEGSSGRKQAIEGGGSTRGFGITSISDGLKSFLGAKGLNAEEMSDRDLFNEYVDYEAQRAEKDYPNWNQMPDPLKAIIVDMYYNAGGTSRMPSFNKAIKNNDWAKAGDETLDVVSANDPKTNQSAVLRGLANRRVEFYNELAKDIGKPVIDDFTITPSEIEGKKTTITYNTADGPKVYNFPGSLHSASGSYDESKKKSEVTEIPQTTETIVSRETQPPIPSLEVPEEVDPLAVQRTAMETPEEVDPLSVTPTTMETPEEVDPLAVSPKFQPQTVVYDPPVDVPKLQREIASIYRMDNQADTIQRSDLYNEEYFSFVQDRDRIWEAAWRQFAPYESLRRFVYDTVGDYEDDPDYDPAGDKRIPKDSLWRFRDSGSFDETTVLLERLKNDLEDMSVLQSSDSTIPSAVASFASPSTLAPLAPLKLLRSTSSLRRFVGGGAFSAAVTAPEELLMAEELQTRDASHAALSLAAISLIGGSINAVAGGPARSFRRTTADDFDDTGEPVYRSAGASANPERARETAFKTMEQDALKETGVGLEGVPWNPVNRLLKSENPFVRKLASELVDFGGMMQKKVDQEIAQTQSAETNFRTRFIPSLVESIKNSEMQYLKYRGINVSDSGIKIKIKQTTSFFNDIMKPAKRRPYISNIEFRVRVGKAMRRGDKDAVQDAATPFVEQAAKGYRKQLELLKDEATRLRMFEKQILGQIKTAREAGLVDEVDRLEKALAKIQAEGVTVNTALSYLPRVYRIDKIMNNPELFISKVSNWAVRTKGMNRKDANLFANDVFDTVTNSRPYLDLADGDTFDFVVKPGSIKQRTLEIPDEEIEEFLESDVEVLIKNQTFNMGRDIELTRAFGDIEMKGVIDDIVEEWQRIIESGKKSEAPSFEKLTQNINAFANHFQTGVSTTVKMFRGFGEGGKVLFAKNAFGDGIYLARTKKTAKLFGEKLNEVAVNLKNPIVFKSDDDVLSFLSLRKPQKAEQLRKAKNSLFEEINSITSLMKSKAPVEEVLSKVKALEGGLLKEYNKLRAEAFEEISSLARSEGYDSAVFSMKQINFFQATKGELTGSKIIKEYQSLAKEIDTAMLRQQFSHDQIVLFNKIDDYEMPFAPRSPKERANLSKMAERDIKDIRALRDRVRGTYGAAKDPHAITSRFIRAMKSINVIVGMGGGVIASIPDVARTVMVEGFTMTNEKGLRHLFKSNQSTFKKLMKDELNAAGVAADAVLGLRASAFADMSDLFGSRYTFERKLNQSAGLMFVINGMNLWNEALKMFAGTVTALRMTKHIMQDWSSLSKANKEKFLKNGIDQQMHLRMRMQIEKHGEVVDGEFMPNTANWTDQGARQTFRNALNQNVDRIIVTPGAGDRALWTSRELGSAMTQFKSYGQGSMVRMTASGLQERDGAFWQGAFLLVGLGAMVNEIKRLQYGLDNDETFEQKLFNAVDRSGILGWFADVNNAFEKVTDYKMGLGPMLGTESRSYVPEEAKLSSIAGPSLSNILTASSVAADVLTFNADQKTLNDLRFITPGSNLPYLDPIYDGVFGQ